MPDGLLNQFLAYGTAAERAAFAPAPPSVLAGPSPLYFWWETDTGHLYAYDTTWHDLGSGSSATNLDSLSDVDTTSSPLPQDGDCLIYDASVSPGVWRPGKPRESLIIACSDETTALTAGTSKVTFRMPYAFYLTSVKGSLSTAQTSGGQVTVDINEAGSSILSTKIIFDNGSKTSLGSSPAAALSDIYLADDAEITVDIDNVGDGTAKGLKVYLIGHRT